MKRKLHLIRGSEIKLENIKQEFLGSGGFIGERFGKKPREKEKVGA